MALTKTQKQKIIADLKDKIARQKAMIFVNFSGLKVKDILSLRKKIKETGNELKVAKKTLLDLSFKNKGLEKIIDVKKLKGEIALIFGYQNEIIPAKISWQFSQENPNLKILGGLIENKFWNSEEVFALAQLPTREELLTKLLGSISAPLSNFVNVLFGNLRNFVYILSQIKVTK
ncbi:MAG: 50S ribosomal protein L10 [Candidatus Nealsonbacteria bacterium]|nr:50S ribosomal protein L10 [Candidatus Nealsonbacteria bacterium]